MTNHDNGSAQASSEKLVCEPPCHAFGLGCACSPKQEARLLGTFLAGLVDGGVDDLAREILASDWLAAHDAAVRADERQRAAVILTPYATPPLTLAELMEVFDHDAHRAALDARRDRLSGRRRP